MTGAALNLLLTAIDESYDEMVEDVASQLDSSEEARPIIRRLLSMVALSGCIGQLDTVASNACGPLSVLGFSKIIDESDFTRYLCSHYICGRTLRRNFAT